MVTSYWFYFSLGDVMKPGIYENVTWSEYLAIEAMNASTLKHGRRSMRRLRRAMDGECEPSQKTTAVGNAVHCMLAGELEQRYAVMPDFENDEGNTTADGGKPKNPKATKYYKAKAAEWEANCELEVLSEVQLNTAKKVLRNVRDAFISTIEHSRMEVVVVGVINGVKCKCRLDGLIPPKESTWDLKVTADASDQGFYRTYKQLGYGISAAMHYELLDQNGIKLKEYRYLLAEPGDDYDTRMIEVPIIVIENELDRLYRLVDEYANCKNSGIWPGMGDGMLAVPDWDMPEAEIEWSK